MSRRRKRYDSSSSDDDDSEDESTVSGGSTRGRSSTKSRKIPKELVENIDSGSKSKKLDKKAKKELKKKKKKKEKKRRKKEKKKEKEKEKRSKSRKHVDVSSSDYDSSDSEISEPNDKISSVARKSTKISTPMTSRNQVLPDSTIVSKPSILKKESSFVDAPRPISENLKEIKKSKILPVVEPIRKSSSTTTATESTVTTPEETPYQHHRANTVANVSNIDVPKDISLRSPRRTTAEENPRQSSALPPAANPPSTSSITIDNISNGFPTIITTSQPHIVKIAHIPGRLPQILCVCSDNVIYRYNLLNGQPLQPSLVGHSDRVTCLSVSNPFFAPNSRTGEKDIRVVAASGATDGVVRIWDLSDGRCIQLISAFPSIPCWAVDVCVRFNGQISLIASGGESAASRRHNNHGARTQRSVDKVLDDVVLYDAISGKRLQTFVHPVVDDSLEDLAMMRRSHVHDSRVTSLLVHQPMATESLLVTAGTCTDIFVWSLNAAVLLCILRGHVDGITSLAISSFPSLSSSSARVAKEEIPSIASILDQPLQTHESAGPLSAQTTCLISSSKDATIRVWDLRRGRTTYIWTKHRFGVQSVSTTVSPLIRDTRRHGTHTSLASPGTPLCLSVGDDGMVCTWNVATGRLLKRETHWHQGLSAITKLTPTTYLRHVDTVCVPVTESPHAATPVEQRVLIATCAWNNSVQCHELYQDVLRQSKMCCVT